MKRRRVVLHGIWLLSMIHETIPRHVELLHIVEAQDSFRPSPHRKNSPWRADISTTPAASEKEFLKGRNGSLGSFVLDRAPGVLMLSGAFDSEPNTSRKYWVNVPPPPKRIKTEKVISAAAAADGSSATAVTKVPPRTDPLICHSKVSCANCRAMDCTWCGTIFTAYIGPRWFKINVGFGACYGVEETDCSDVRFGTMEPFLAFEEETPLGSVRFELNVTKFTDAMAPICTEFMVPRTAAEANTCEDCLDYRRAGWCVFETMSRRYPLGFNAGAVCLPEGECSASWADFMNALHVFVRATMAATCPTIKPVITSSITSLAVGGSLVCGGLLILLAGTFHNGRMCN